MEDVMKNKLLILVALLGVIILPVYGSESMPKSEEDTKSRMALVAACSASGEAVADQDAQQGIVSKPKSDDEQLRDGHAILHELIAKRVDGDGKGLPPEICKIIMTYLQKIEGRVLKPAAEGRGVPLSAYSFAINIGSNQRQIVDIGNWLQMCDKDGHYLKTLGKHGHFKGPYSRILTHKIHDEAAVTASFGEGEVCTWNVEGDDAALLSQLKVDEPCRSLTFDEHNTLLGVSLKRKEGILKVWDINQNTCIKELHVGDCTDCVLACGADNEIVIVVGKKDGHIELWDVKTGACISIVRGHTEIGTSLSKTVKLDGDESREVLGLAVCKNRDNGHVLIASSARNSKTGCLDGLVYVWDAQTGECVQLLHKKYGWEEDFYWGMRVVGMDYNDKGELEVYGAHHDSSVKAFKCIPGDYEQALKAQKDLEKARALIQQQRDSSGTYNGQGLPPVLQRIVYEYAKPE